MNTKAEHIDSIIEIPAKKVHTASRFVNKFAPVLLQLLADIAGITSSYLIQYYLVFESGLFRPIAETDTMMIILPAVALNIFWITIFFFSGLYKNWFEKSPFEEFFTLLKSTLIGCAIAFFFVIYYEGVERMMILVYFGTLTINITIARFIARKIQYKLRISGFISFPSIIIGSFNRAKRIFSMIKKSPKWGIKALGIVTLNSGPENEVIGTIDNFKKIIDEYTPFEVILCMGTNQKMLMEIVSYCAERDITIKIEPDLYHIFTGQSRTHNIYGIPLIEISPQLLRPWQAVLKRLFDICFSASVLVIGSPVWFLLAISIKLESKGKAIFKQLRVGKNEKLFTMYKFRSMYTGSDKNGLAWTKVNDPRVTKIGKFIRKTHLDEIPQFINVFKGDMSIVGPRPEQPNIVEKYTAIFPYYKRRLKVRPGITGWWQVKYQPFEMNEEEIENRLKDDFYYIENMSIKFDVEIVIRTVYCVLTGHGQT